MTPLDIAKIEVGARPYVEGLWQQKLPQVHMPSLNLRTLRKALAFELQMKSAPALSPQAKQVLKAHEPKACHHAAGMNEASGSGAPALRSTRGLKRGASNPTALTPGAVLIREWNGRRYQVTVGQGNYEMDGRTYKSLTQVAKAITGAHWSGPRFFGLVKAPSKKVQKA